MLLKMILQLIFTFIILFLFILVITFFMVIDDKSFVEVATNILLVLFSVKYSEKITDKVMGAVRKK